eukprot:s580_g21.t1
MLWHFCQIYLTFSHLKLTPDLDTIVRCLVHSVWQSQTVCTLEVNAEAQIFQTTTNTHIGTVEKFPCIFLLVPIPQTSLASNMKDEAKKVRCFCHSWLAALLPAAIWQKWMVLLVLLPMPGIPTFAALAMENVATASVLFSLGKSNVSRATSPLPEPTSADASRQGPSHASEELRLTAGRCSASEQTLHGGPSPLPEQTSAVEFYDMAADDEPGDRAASVASETWDEQKVQHISAGLEFLGFVENKKLVPAVSSFRRMLKKSARTAARHKEKDRSAIFWVGLLLGVFFGNIFSLRFGFGVWLLTYH